MLHWLPYPFLRITPLFCLGILLSTALEQSLTHLLVLIFLAVASVCVVFAIQRSKKFFSLNTISGFFLAILIVVLGLLRASTSNQIKQPSHFTNSDFEYYSGKVVSWPEPTTDFVRLVIAVDQIRSDQWYSKTGKVQLYLHKSQEASAIKYLDHLVVKGRPSDVKGPSNPLEFDYMQFLARKNIFHQHFVDLGGWEVLVNENWNIQKLAYYVRERSEMIIDNQLPEMEEGQILKAMILGIKSGLDPALETAYAGSGAMHILAISGLHVGILYLMLSILLRPLKSIKYGRWFYGSMVILPLCFYAFVVGLTPSVSRAVLMFSLITVGSLLYKRANIYNIIFFSAFSLLVINPNQIFQVGFQLSYLALLGIVTIYPMINSVFDSKYTSLNYLWSISSLSIAAQLATFPLTIFYFKSFPGFFLFANLVVIPAAFCLLAGGILILIGGFFGLDFITELLSSVVTYVASMTNDAVEYLSWGNINPISISPWVVVTIYLLVISVICLIKYRNISWYYLVCGLVLTLIISAEVRNHSISGSNGVMVYQKPYNTILDFTNEGSITTFMKLQSDSTDISYQVSNYRAGMGFKSVPSQETIRFENAGVSGQLISHDDQVILILEGGLEPGSVLPMRPLVNADLVVLTRNCTISPGQLRAMYDPNTVVSDGSNAPYIYDRFEDSLLESPETFSYINTNKTGGIFIDL